MIDPKLEEVVAFREISTQESVSQGSDSWEEASPLKKKIDLIYLDIVSESKIQVKIATSNTLSI